MKINGTNGQDTLKGTRWDDEINAFGGNDTIIGYEGADRIDGGSGTDSVSYFGFVETHVIRSPTIYVGGAVDVDLQRPVQHGGFAEGDVLINIENVEGSRFDDIIRGNSSDNVLVGDFGDDVLEGRDGDDILSGDRSSFFPEASEEDEFPESGDDILDGGAGDDILFGDGGNDTLRGGADRDLLFGESGDDTLDGGTGFNSLDGGTGNDTATYAAITHGVHVLFTDSTAGLVFGINGNTVADDFNNIERFIGTSFNDIMEGSLAANTFEGGAGNDTLRGFAGSDTLKGGTGDDLLEGGSGGDELVGGVGNDTATYAASNAAVNVNLGVLTPISTPFGVTFLQSTPGAGLGGHAQGDSLFLVENLIGSNFGDTLTGNLAANRLDGGAGDDSISGGAGNDILIGGSEVNTDRLTGGAGSDTFLYLSRDDSRFGVGGTPDFIQDFNVSQDLIDLQALGVNAANLVIEDLVVGGVNVSRITEDLNGNGAVDIGEFSILAQIDGAGFVTAQDILV